MAAAPSAAEDEQVAGHPGDSSSEKEPASLAGSDLVPDRKISLRILQAAGKKVRIHPFSQSGEPMPAAFEALEKMMACADGRSSRPDARLVRVLVDLQAEFKQALRILGGHCPDHGPGHASHDHHPTGKAIDVRVWGIRTSAVMDWFEGKPVGAVGRYAKKSFVHVDLRAGNPVRWEADAPAAQAKRTENAIPRRPAAVAAVSSSQSDPATIDATQPAKGTGPTPAKPAPMAAHAKQ